MNINNYVKTLTNTFLYDFKISKKKIGESPEEQNLPFYNLF